MFLNLTDLSSESLQNQIFNQIRAKILSGELEAGNDIPSIRKLSRENHVSVITVQRAYEHLEREEMIYSRRGKGFFVSELSEETKQDMVKKRLMENIKLPLTNAFEEGMKKEDILKTISQVIQKKSDLYKGRK